jgi:flagellar hook-length control protein FliK
MRIGTDLAPIAATTESRTADAPPAEAFSALLAAAGLVVNADAAPTSTASGPSAPTGSATTTGSATPASAPLLAPLVEGASAAPSAQGASPTTAPAADGFDMSTLAITVHSAPTAAATTGVALGLRPGGTQSIAPTTVDAAAGTAPATDAAGAVTGTPPATGAPAPATPGTSAAPAPEPTATTAGAPTTAAPTTAAVTPAGAPTGEPATTTLAPAPVAEPPKVDDADAAPVGGLRAAELAPPTGGRGVTATEQPIAPSRFAGVAVAAARASAEADRPVRLSVRLDPPNLGEVRVELSSRNGVVTVRVEPVSDAAGPLLNQQRSAVAAALERTGFSLASFDVAAGERQHDQQQQKSRRAARTVDVSAIDGAPINSTTAGPTGLRI